MVDRETLEQELISIDENLVRAPPGLELERSLNRGREIYESLNPEVTRVELSAEEPKGEERKAQAEREEQDEDSFAAVTSEKTGLSKAVIKSAIKRDALAAEAVKTARSQGDINATQTNEIIKLEKETQAEILPLVADKTVKEVKRIVAAAQEGGVEAAIEESKRVVPLPREFRQILGPVKRVNRNITRILVEELHYHGPEREKIHRELRQLRDNLEQYLLDGRGAGMNHAILDSGRARAARRIRCAVARCGGPGSGRIGGPSSSRRCATPRAGAS